MTCGGRSGWVKAVGAADGPPGRAGRPGRDAGLAAQRYKRLSSLGVQVSTAHAERDAPTAGCELRAGQALLAMARLEGLRLADAIGWCGPGVTTREAGRLHDLAATASGVTDAIGGTDRSPSSDPT